MKTSATTLLLAVASALLIGGCAADTEDGTADEEVGSSTDELETAVTDCGSSKGVNIVAQISTENRNQIGINFNGYNNDHSNVKGTLKHAGKFYSVRTDDNIPANEWVKRDLKFSSSGKTVTLQRGDQLHLMLIVDVPWQNGRDKKCQTVALTY